jgi:hypothetical protein
MASVAFHHFNQFRETAKVRLFGEYGGYAPGEQSRDFVFVNDVVAVNLWFLQHPDQSGIFNLGTGRAQPFNDVAVATVNAVRALHGEAPLPIADLIAQGLLEYIDFPDALKGKYQCFTQADLTQLRSTGCDHRFADVATGIACERCGAAWLAWDRGRKQAAPIPQAPVTQSARRWLATVVPVRRDQPAAIAASAHGERELTLVTRRVAVAVRANDVSNRIGVRIGQRAQA